MMEKKLGSKRVFSFCFLFSLCLHGGVLFFLENFYFFRTTPLSHDKSFAAREKMVLPSRREDSPILRVSFHQTSSHGGVQESISWENGSSLRKEKEDFGSIHAPSFLGKKREDPFVPLRFSTKQKNISSPVKEIGVPQKRQVEMAPSLKEKVKAREVAPIKEEAAEKKSFSKPEEPLAKTELPSPPLSISQTGDAAPLKEEAAEKKNSSKPEESLAKTKVASPAASVSEEPSHSHPSDSSLSEIAPFRCKSDLFEPKKAAFPKPGKKGTLINRRSPLVFHMPTSSDLHILSCGNDFDLDVVYNLREDGEGYLFALSLIPKKNISFQRIKQNYLFLLDRSHSIGEERFYSTKAALFSALSLLDREDTFNIIAFDKKNEALFEKNMPANAAMIRHAKEFLQKQKIAGIFTTTNISRPLFLGSQQLMKEAGSRSIIYFSNGETLDKAGHKKALHDWTQNNKGAISFYSVIQKGDKKGRLLEYLSALNKGKLFASQTPSGFRRTLRKLISSIRTPLAQNMEAYVYLMKGGTEVTLYPSLKQMPNLYLDQPFVVIGTTKKLEPFTLFLQGKNKGQWFHIKKDISFQNARSSGPFLYEEWALQRAYRCYDAYLQDGNEDHLKEAKELLTPFCVEEAFR